MDESEELKPVDQQYKALKAGPLKDCFQRIEDGLRKVRDSNGNNDEYVCFIAIDENKGRVIYIVDIYDEETPEDYYETGTIWYDSEGQLDKLTRGNTKGRIQNITGGEIVLAKAAPVYDSAGKLLGYIEVDIFTSKIIQTKRQVFVLFFLFIILIIILLSFIILAVLNHGVIKPIKKIEDAGRRFNVRSKIDIFMAPEYFANLNLHTGDEIESLWLTMADMEINIALSMRKIRQMTSEKELLNAELALANKIQTSMLPDSQTAFSDREEFEIYANMVPARDVGGDLYDFFLIDDDHLAMAIGDVSGKGVSAALFMVKAMSQIRTYTLQNGTDVQTTVEKINEVLFENNQARMFVTLWLGVLTISTGELTYVNAGHVYPAFCRAGGEFTILKDIHGGPVAARKGMRFKPGIIKLEPGDILYHYTDGLTEAVNGAKEMFGKSRLIEALNEKKDAGLKERDDHVRLCLDTFTGAEEAFDDTTSLCIIYRGRTGAGDT
jgi:sigma-B regulation protein RsbU (phosphoserine phosphatase)